jgi:hypothetical protein
MNLPVNYNTLSQSERRLIREQYIEIQEGKCSHCGESLNQVAPPPITSMKINKNLFPVNFFKYPVHLHHNHETGMTIGAVHCHCNAVLWQYHGE